ncbi:hypothetical protein MCHI_001840 [Candidatus Magnetoovum chiemensis]|nr:hypothetical protein MCHI_001840 [Candidatus Magnetoovum chiemensis]
MMRSLTFKLRKLFFSFMLITLLSTNRSELNAEWTEWAADTKLAVTYNDNVNKGLFEIIREHDLYVTPSASFGRYYQLADTTRLKLAVSLQAEFHNNFERLNTISPGISLALNHKFGIGKKPWIQFTGSAHYLDVNDNARDSMVYSTGIKAGKRLNERIDASAAYTLSHRDGKSLEPISPLSSGNVFDQTTHTWSVISNFLLTQKLMLSVDYSFMYGDVDSSCNPTVAGWIINDVDAMTHDDGYDKPWCVYKVKANAHNISFGASYALSGHSSVNLGYTIIRAHAIGSYYPINLLQSSIIYAF